MRELLASSLHAISDVFATSLLKECKTNYGKDSALDEPQKTDRKYVARPYEAPDKPKPTTYADPIQKIAYSVQYYIYNGIPFQDAKEMLEAAGYKNVYTYDRQIGVGLGIHEMGTARMGKDPKTSVLNKWNQVHACKNVFVTDGSFMTSAACHNPSLGYMAFTARAVDYAVSEMNKNNL